MNKREISDLIVITRYEGEGVPISKYQIDRLVKFERNLESSRLWVHKAAIKEIEKSLDPFLRRQKSE